MAFILWGCVVKYLTFSMSFLVNDIFVNSMLTRVELKKYCWQVACSRCVGMDWPADLSVSGALWHSSKVTPKTRFCLFVFICYTLYVVACDSYITWDLLQLFAVLIAIIQRILVAWKVDTHSVTHFACIIDSTKCQARLCSSEISHRPHLMHCSCCTHLASSSSKLLSS